MSNPRIYLGRRYFNNPPHFPDSPSFQQPPRISLARQRFNERRESLLTKFAEQIALPIVVAFGLGVLVTLSVLEGRQSTDLACEDAAKVAIAKATGEAQ